MNQFLYEYFQFMVKFTYTLEATILLSYCSKLNVEDGTIIFLSWILDNFTSTTQINETCIDLSMFDIHRLVKIFTWAHLIHPSTSSEIYYQRFFPCLWKSLLNLGILERSKYWALSLIISLIYHSASPKICTPVVLFMIWKFIFYQNSKSK